MPNNKRLRIMLPQIHRLRLAEVGIAALIVSGCLRQSVEPKPPDGAIPHAARTAVAEYAQRLADSFEDTARQLESQSLTTAAETNTRLQSANAEARRAAFQPLDQRLNDELGGDRWDADKAQQLFDQIARGLRSVR